MEEVIRIPVVEVEVPLGGHLVQGGSTPWDFKADGRQKESPTATGKPTNSARRQLPGSGKEDKRGRVDTQHLFSSRMRADLKTGRHGADSDRAKRALSNLTGLKRIR